MNGLKSKRNRSLLTVSVKRLTHGRYGLYDANSPEKSIPFWWCASIVYYGLPANRREQATLRNYYKGKFFSLYGVESPLHRIALPFSVKSLSIGT
jgi:hypothetical protein